MFFQLCTTQTATMSGNNNNNFVEGDQQSIQERQRINYKIEWQAVDACK
jgi:hypothetical protein